MSPCSPARARLATAVFLFQLMSVVYVALTAVWLGEMLRLRQHVLPVHFLCLVCVFVKAVQSILVAVYYHRQVRNTEYACSPI